MVAVKGMRGVSLSVRCLKSYDSVIVHRIVQGTHSLARTMSLDPFQPVIGVVVVALFYSSTASHL